MATKIRLKRIGRRNRPFFRLIVIDSRKRRDGAAIEELGWYNPIASNVIENFMLKEDRILHWLGEGAETSEIAHKLLKRAGIALKWHLMKQGLDETAIEKEMQKWKLNQVESQKVKVEKKKAKKVDEKSEKETEKEVIVDESVAAEKIVGQDLEGDKSKDVVSEDGSATPAETDNKVDQEPSEVQPDEEVTSEQESTAEPKVDEKKEETTQPETEEKSEVQVETEPMVVAPQDDIKGEVQVEEKIKSSS